MRSEFPFCFREKNYCGGMYKNISSSQNYRKKGEQCIRTLHFISSVRRINEALSVDEIIA